MECARKAHAANFATLLRGKSFAFCDLIIPFSLLKNSAKVVILFSSNKPVYCGLRKRYVPRGWFAKIGEVFMLYAYYTLPAKPNSKIVIEVFMGSWQFSLYIFKKIIFFPQTFTIDAFMWNGLCWWWLRGLKRAISASSQGSFAWRALTIWL